MDYGQFTSQQSQNQIQFTITTVATRNQKYFSLSRTQVSSFNEKWKNIPIARYKQL